MSNIDLDTPIWQLTVGQFLELSKEVAPKVEIKQPDKKYAYGLKGLQEILGCSESRASEIKQSGILGDAIKQNGKMIITDIELAISRFDNTRKKNRK